MTRKPKPLGPAWLADMVIALGSWRASLLVMWLSWMFRHWRLVGAVTVAAVVFVWTASLPLAGVALVGLYGASRWRPAKRKARWWDHDTLSGAFVAAGTLKMVGEKVPTLSYQGKVQHNDYGDTAVIGLPQARGLEDVTPRRLAQALRIPVSRLTLSQEPDDNANVVRVHVGAPTPKKAPPPAVADADQTDWSRPAKIGRDERGWEVVFTTTETHTVVAGATGSGKSKFGQLIVSNAVLDPRVKIYGIDGKGDSGAKGWQYLEPLCEAFVRGMGPDSPARIEALLSEVSALSERRGAAGDESPEILLILEEWATARTVLARLDSKAAERCDNLVTVLLATARSRGIHVLLIVQRGTNTSFPTDQRANCGQRIVGKFGDRSEAGYVLESLPARLPARAGEFLLSLDGKPPTLVTVDHLTDEAWRKVCKRAAALRRPPLTLPPPPQLVQSAGEGVDPLRAAALRVLVAGDLRGMPATELLDALPVEARRDCTTPQALGFRLRRWPDLFERANIGHARGWRATATARVGGGTVGSAGFWSAGPCERAEGAPNLRPAGSTAGFEDGDWEPYGGGDEPEDDPA